MFWIITIVILLLATVITLLRMIKSPTVWDRLLTLNLIAIKLFLALTILSVYKGNTSLLDVTLAYGVVGFIGVTLFARFLTQGGRVK